MAFFKKLGERVVFASGRHAGEDIVKVAREDPKYLQWARRDRTIGLPLNLFEFIENVMLSNSVPFSNRKPRKRKKKS